MTERGDAEFLQILAAQGGQQVRPDVVLLEGRRVLLEPKRPQPLGNVHRCLPRQQIEG
jgi:hypothetical protein